ncbi:hypothetical protein [Kitasatospora purpeofusca]|uniref:hypothetical protein n=1 Tax=Kitasatospora purpeofusca TaxID=67352 RepID=UPI003667F9CC
MLVPADTWFAQPQLVDSIHGIRHNARVSLLAGLLAQEYGLDPDHTAALCTAAAVHDCRRRDDRDDPGHGRRAALWFTRNQQAVTTMLGRELPPGLSQRDRYRLPLTRWWPDPSHLRIVIPAWLHPVAFDLVVRSEQARLNGATNHGALIHAGQLLNPRQ